MIAKPVFSAGGCLGCHPTQNKPDLTSFDKIEAVYLTDPGTASLLVTKGDHQGIKFFGDDKKKIISDWLDSLP